MPWATCTQHAEHCVLLQTCNLAKGKTAYILPSVSTPLMWPMAWYTLETERILDFFQTKDKKQFLCFRTLKGCSAT